MFHQNMFPVVHIAMSWLKYSTSEAKFRTDSSNNDSVTWLSIPMTFMFFSTNMKAYLGFCKWANEFRLSNPWINNRHLTSCGSIRIFSASYSETLCWTFVTPLMHTFYINDLWHDCLLIKQTEFTWNSPQLS